MLSTIGLIDRDVVIRLGLGLMINRDFSTRVLEADNLTSFSTQHGKAKLDLILLGNYGSPNLCYQTVLQLKNIYSDTPLIVYDESDSRSHTLKYLELGVSGYLLRRSMPEEMIPCINNVIEGKRYLSAELLQHLLTSFYGRINPTKTKTRLTDRESQIANMLCMGMKTSLIADTLARKPSTISTIKNNVLKKMGVKNVIELSQAIGQELPENQYDPAF